MELVAAGRELLFEPGELGVERALPLHDPGDGVLLGGLLARTYVDATELTLDVGGDDLVGRAEVVHDLGDLLGDPGEHLDVSRQRAVGPGRRRCEVADLGRLGLAVTVDAADALLEPVGVERDVEVDQSVAVMLQIDALAGSIGGEQDPHLRLGGVLVEPRTDQLARQRRPCCRR